MVGDKDGKSFLDLVGSLKTVVGTTVRGKCTMKPGDLW